jgi:phospholipid N-methyltransferase
VNVSPAQPYSQLKAPSSIETRTAVSKSWKIKSILRRKLNGILDRYGYELVWRRQSAYGHKFLPLRKTLADAKASGMSLSDYIDAEFNVAGATPTTIESLYRLGVFANPIETACEIGPGSGRFLEKIIKICKPARYEVYEIDRDWADWLSENFNVVCQTTDGETLRFTPTASMDLVQAYRVFVAQPVLVTLRYLEEMARVVRPGGFVVFDVLDESCLSREALATWLSSGSVFPSLVPSFFVTGVFNARGFKLIGTFSVPLRPGLSKYYVFQAPGGAR